MTSDTVSSAETLEQKLHASDIRDGFLKLERTLRPNEGWVASVLLVLNLIVVVWSVEQADWVATPNLVLILLLAMLTGLALYRLPVWPIALLPAGTPQGHEACSPAATIVRQDRLEDPSTAPTCVPLARRGIESP